MLRRREVHGSPLRDAIETCNVIAELIASSLEQASVVPAGTVEATLAAAQPAVRMLVAAGELDNHPLTLTAGNTTCEIYTISGRPALKGDENLAPIVGMSNLEDYALYLPCGPFDAATVAAASNDAHLFVGPPPSENRASTGAPSRPMIDVDALRGRLGQQ